MPQPHPKSGLTATFRGGVASFLSIGKERGVSGQVVWDSDEVSRASSILEASGENVAAYVLDTPSGVGSNEGRLSERIAKINEVIAMGSFCSLAVAQGLDAASSAFAQADDQAAAEIAAVREYLDSLDSR